ncbi:hypothetical protein ACFXOK_02120 [Streptomyces sp. NPDC059173]|uniref:hypothetical protein n=1 Tax=Streptomyces sp. NPDC059173 TaxID=3346756 RepID=UPI00369BEA82
MTVIDVWLRERACPSCGEAEYAKYQKDTETGQIVGRSMGRRCDGECTPEEVERAQR